MLNSGRNCRWLAFIIFASGSGFLYFVYVERDENKLVVLSTTKFNIGEVTAINHEPPVNNKSVIHRDIKQTALPNETTHKNNLLNKQGRELSDFIQQHHDTMMSSNLVLLVTYMRSGSSWLGDITRQAQDSMYFFEPFQHLLKEGYYTNGSVCYYNNICRRPRTHTEYHHEVIRSVLQLFACEFSNLHRIMLRNVLDRAKRICVSNGGNASIGMSGYIDRQTAADRRLKKPIATMRKNLYSTECQEIVTETCRAARYRIIKTIRLSMSLVQTLMDILPNLKVIHLMRDPRGITNSRVHAGRKRMAHLTVPHSIALCNQMQEDIRIGNLILKKRSGNFKVVTYEDLAEKPVEGAKVIYEFLKITFDKKIEKWVYKSSHAAKDTGFYGTQRTNSNETLSHWRKELSFNETMIIQKYCKDVLQLLGYISFDTEQQQTNLSIPSKRKPLNEF